LSEKHASQLSHNMSYHG